MPKIKAHYVLHLDGFTLDAGFTAPARGITAIFGPSGSGKTTLLRCIAGLEKPEKGYLKIGNDTWHDRQFVPVHRRSLGYVFQEPSLFSFMSVRENLMYGYRRVPFEKRTIHPEQVIELLGLGKLIDRNDTHRLSGGEKQRVAIGRALLTSPELLLMDEPLSALDANSKRDIYPYLETLHERMKIPVLYVSHSTQEIARLADYLVLLEQGKVKKEGKLNDVMAGGDFILSPAGSQWYDETDQDPTIARVTPMVVLKAEILKHHEQYAMTLLDFSQTGKGDVWTRKIDHPPGSQVRLQIKASDVSLALERNKNMSITNILPGKIENIRKDQNGSVLVVLSIRPQGDESQKTIPLFSKITDMSLDRLKLRKGMQVYAQVKSMSLVV